MNVMSEEVMRRNILAIKEYSEQTREIVRGIESCYSNMEMMANDIRAIKEQIAALQVKVYSGGATQ